MAKTLNLVGFDCGNSSYRVVLGRFDGERIALETVFRAENRPVRVGDAYYWNMLGIFAGLKTGLAAAVARAGSIDSIGICAWGVDFSLLDAGGNLVGNSLCYRNPFGREELDLLSPRQRRWLFDRTGILCDRINTIYTLLSMKKRMPAILSAARHVLMAPDALNYLFCGEIANEPSELSTTQLMDTRRGAVSGEVCREFAIDPALFGRIPRHGEAIGMLRRDIRDEVGLAVDVPVVAVPSHDTASAVLAVPADGAGRFAFVSAGTWSLIGVELAEPVIDDAAYAAGLTNEVGAFGRVTLLRNNAGMYIFQRLREEYEAELGRPAAWEDLTALARKRDGEPLLFDVNHPDLFAPPRMGEAVWRRLSETGEVGAAGPDWPSLFAAFHHSLAAAWGAVIEDAGAVSGGPVDAVYVVGGGTRNDRLNQLAATYSGLEVVLGSPESASLGAILAQLRHFDPSLDVVGLRRIARASVEERRFRPAGDGGGVLARYRSLARA